MRILLTISVLLLGGHCSAQLYQLLIAPCYALAIDTSEWQPLFERPEPLSLSHTPLSQALLHRPTGLIVSIQTGYTPDIQTFEWLKTQSQKLEFNGTKMETSALKALTEQPKQSQFQLLFGRMDALEQYNLTPFEAFAASSNPSPLPQYYVWHHDVHYIRLACPNELDATSHNLLRGLLPQLSKVEPALLDQSYQQWPALSDAELLAYRKRILQKKQCAPAEALALAQNDSLLLADRQFPFSFKAFDEYWVSWSQHKVSMEEMISLQHLWPQRNGNPFFQYYLTPFRQTFLLRPSYYEQIMESLPSRAHLHEPLIPQIDEQLDHYFAFNDSVFYVFQIDYRGALLRYQIDSIGFSHYTKTSDRIERKHYKPSGFDSPFDVKTQPGQPALLALSTTAQWHSKGQLYKGFEETHYLSSDCDYRKMVSFTPPKSTKDYLAFVGYEMDKNEIDLLQKWLDCRDTLRYYQACDFKDELPTIFMYRGNEGKALQTSPAQRLYGTAIFTTDLNKNNHLEYWQFYASNGAWVKTNFFASFAADDTLKIRAPKLQRYPFLQKMLKTSLTTGINDHQVLAMDALLESYITEEIVGQVDGDLEAPSAQKMANDTTVYQYPERHSYYTKIDPQGARFLETQLNAKRFNDLLNHAYYKVSFIVEKDGSRTGVQVQCLNQRKMMAIENSLLDAERLMPNWQPALMQGHPVRSYGEMYFGIVLKK